MTDVVGQEAAAFTLRPTAPFNFAATVRTTGRGWIDRARCWRSSCAVQGVLV
ncbi:MAG: hypothetical protein ACYCU3_08090 [Streptosporangiaceae bacterium]